jgi:segregation and condensation protein A
MQALVEGEPYKLPEDLFIPPDALEVLLTSFSGPLDLLLYLIRKQNIDILDIPIVSITKQYLQYIHLMEKKRLELAADYLVMAALLAEIKSRCLLPLVASELEEEGDDPRMELVRRLQLYETIKTAAEALDNLPRLERDHFVLQLNSEVTETLALEPEVSISALIEAMQSIVKREDCLQHHQISAEPLSVRERMATILALLQDNNILPFTQLFSSPEGRGGVIVSLLAILELARQSMIVITQVIAYSPIYLEAAGNG